MQAPPVDVNAHVVERGSWSGSLAVPASESWAPSEPTYGPPVEAVGGEFVDIWDGFVSENGDFIVSGSDVNGQQVRLRTSDGVAVPATLSASTWAVPRPTCA